jgi:hypothetical protein
VVWYRQWFELRVLNPRSSKYVPLSHIMWEV